MSRIAKSDFFLAKFAFSSESMSKHSPLLTVRGSGDGKNRWGVGDRGAKTVPQCSKPSSNLVFPMNC